MGVVAIRPPAFSFWSRTAARVRTNLPGTSFSVWTNLVIGACIVPMQLGEEFLAARAWMARLPTSFALIT